MSFYKSPFIIITLSLILGIYLSYPSVLNDVVLFSTFVIGFIGLLFFKRSYLVLPSIIILFISIGSFLGAERGFVKAKFVEKKFKQEQYVLQIDKINSSKSGWSRVEGVILNSDLKDEKVLLLAQNFSFSPDEVICFETLFSRINNNGNPGEFDSEHYYGAKGINYIAFLNEKDNVSRLRKAPTSYMNYIDNKRKENELVFDAYLAPKEASIAKALVLGLKSDLDVEVKMNFSNSGAMHLLAVSGLHVGIIYVLLLWFFKQFSFVISRKTALICVVVILWGYALLAGFTPSIIRATFLFSVLSIATLLSKQSNSINSLFFSAFVILLINPFFLFDIGFQLSYLAMIGILVLSKPIASLLNFKNKWIDLLWNGTVVGIAAQIMTAPLALYYFHQFPNYFVLTNLVLILASGVLLGLGVVSLVFASIPMVNLFLFKVFGVFLSFLMSFTEWVSDLEFSVATGFDLSNSDLMLLYSFIALIIFCFKFKTKWILFGMLGLMGGIFKLQLDRYQAISSQHLCFFNSKNPIVFYKDGAKGYCFFSTKSRKEAEKLTRDYIKVYPVEKVNYVALNDHQLMRLKNNQHRLEVEKEEGEWKIHFNQYKIERYSRNRFIKHLD